jgi:hypothetical protein
MFKTRRVIIGVAVVALSLAAFAGPASAAAGDLPVAAGTLGFDQPLGTPAFGAFTGITLNGSPQVTSANLAPYIVTDATGSGSGWNVTIQLSQLTNGGHTLPLDSVHTTAGIVKADPGTTSPVPTMSALTGAANGADHATPQKLASAAASEGMGVYLISPKPFVLTVPANAYVGTYTSTVTVAINSGP